ncbi:hypothetical protein AB0C52_32375 [Streptomyces sp. NPDC048717]|uniref:hypothetical protein n=1 Tax=Streptomyces sp. NPDC048717 TaxID=3154928 RepID=UPI00343BB905
MPSTMRKSFNDVGNAAVEASVERTRSGLAGRIGPDPALRSQSAELRWAEAVLRHRLSRLSLGRPAAIRTRGDHAHPLVADGRHFPAVALSIPFADRSLDFLATSDDHRRLTFDVVGPCGHCGEPVPTEEINRLEDLGDCLLQTREALGGSPHFRTSPAHAATCPARGD